MKKYCIFILAFLCTHTCLSSQNYWSKRFDFDKGNDYGTQVIKVSDGLIVQVNAFCQFNTRDCFGLMKFDTEGNHLWTSVVYDTLEINYLKAMTVKDDTIYLNTDYLGIEGKDYSILKFNLEGQYLNRYDYWHPSVDNLHYARFMTCQQGLFYTHFDFKDTATLKFREGIRVFDPMWNLLWETTVPNNGYPALLWCTSDPTTDGGLAVIYSSWKNPGHKGVATIEKYDSIGTLEWATTLPHEYSSFSKWVNISQHSDGGYVGTWKIDTFGVFIYDRPDILFKLDANGNLLWEKVNFYEQNNFWHFFVAQNGDLIGCGVAENFQNDTIDEPEFQVGYIARFNADGERLWERKIFEQREDAWIHELIGGVELDNGDLVFTGSMDDTSALPDPYPQNVWLVKVDSNGCFTPGCGTEQYLVSAHEPVKEVSEGIFRLFPNPFGERLSLGSVLGRHIPTGTYRARLYDAQGNLIFDKAFQPNLIHDFDTSALPAGFYTLSILRDGKLVQTLKAVK